MVCGGHIVSVHANALKELAKAKSFSKGYQNLHAQTFPDVMKVLCLCRKHHSGCGCLTGGYLSLAKIRFLTCLNQAGTDPQKFAKRLRSLGKYHARDMHQWEKLQEAGTHWRIL